MKSIDTWLWPLFPFVPAFCPGFRGFFERKMASFAPKLRSFGTEPHDLVPALWAANGDFLAENWVLARAQPRLQNDPSGVTSEAMGRGNG